MTNAESKMQPEAPRESFAIGRNECGNGMPTSEKTTPSPKNTHKKRWLVISNTRLPK